MAPSMKAAFTLLLEDKLSSGMKAIGKGFEDLRKAGKELGLGKLESGTELLRTVGREVQNLTGNLRTIEAVADRSWAALKRMSSVTFHGAASFGRGAANLGRRALGPGGLMGAAAAAGGAYAVLKPIRAYAGYQDTLKHIGITAGEHGAANDAGMARRNAMFAADALATGQSSAKIAEAYYTMQTGGIPAERLDRAIGAHSRFATAYRQDPEAASQLSIALMKNMGLNEAQYEAALGQAGQISKQGLFKISGFSQFMPGITGQMKTMGMTGPAATLEALSALQVIRRGTGDDASAATDLRTLLEHIYAPMQERSMRMHGKMVPEELRKQIQENAGAYKSAFGVDYPRYMKEQEAKGIDPLNAYINLMKQLTAAPDFVDKMRTFGQLTHSEQQGIASQGLINNYDEWQKMQAEGRTKGAEVFELDFQEAIRGATTSLGHLDEALGQLERRLGQGFTPVLGPVNTALDGLLGTIRLTDHFLPGLNTAILAVTGSMISLGSALAAIGIVAPAISKGAGVVGTWGVAPELLLALPLAGLASVGSHYETPETRAARDQLDTARRSQAGGPNGPTFDGFGPDGLPLQMGHTMDLTPPGAGGGSQSHWSPGQLDINLFAAPGTSAEVTRAPPNSSIRLNPGSTTTRE
jgi:hypothetical protein